MSVYNIDVLNNELNILENTKNNIKNSLIDKGQNIADNRPFSNYVENIDALGTVHKFNTKGEMDTTTNLPRGTMGIVYSNYAYSNDDTIFTDSIYLPKKLSFTYNEIEELGNNYALGELEIDGENLYVRASVDESGATTNIIVSVNGTDYDYAYNNNVWVRQDNEKDYLVININEDLSYKTYTNYSKEIFQIISDNSLNGLYQYGNMWNIVPLGVTANSETIINGYTALTDEGVVVGSGPIGTTAIPDDIWCNTAWVNGELVTGTLQVNTNVSRYELDKRLNVWNTFSDLDTTSNNLADLFSNFRQKTLPNIRANDVVTVANMYNNCRNLTDINLMRVNTMNMINADNMFSNCKNIMNFTVSSFRTNNLQTASGMFSGCSGINDVRIYSWNTLNLINVSGMFKQCSQLINIDLNRWNIINLKDTSNMFESCYNLKNLNISNWNTYNIENMASMFRDCYNLENISFTNWNTNNLYNIEDIFNGCNLITDDSVANVVNMLPDGLQVTNNNTWNLGIDMDRYTHEQLNILAEKHYMGSPLPYSSKYIITNVDNGYSYVLNKGDALDKNASILNQNLSTEYSSRRMYNIKVWDNLYKEGTLTNVGNLFYNKYLYKTMDLSELNVSNVTSTFNMFYNCQNLTYINTEGWNLSKVVHTFNMFYNCQNLTYINTDRWDLSNVTSMRSMFFYCQNLTSINTDSWDTHKVQNMYQTFDRCFNLFNLDVSNFDTSNVVSMYEMFLYCGNLTNLDVSNWNVSKVTDMTRCFSSVGTSNLDVSKWDVSNVKTFYGMFQYCNNLTTLDVSNWNTINALNLSKMFANTSIVNLNLISWNVSNVTSISELFGGCNYLTSVDISNWDTSKVQYMSKLFAWCTNLESIDISKWNTDNISYSLESLFSMCYKLTDIDVSSLNTGRIQMFTFMFMNCKNLVNIDVSNWNMSSAKNITRMFQACNKLSDDSVDSIINMVLNSVNVTNKDLRVSNMDSSPFYGSNITSARYQNRLAELTEAGWTY